MRDSWVVASANLNLVRSIYAAWERGDYSSDDWAHPDIEWVFADGPAPGRGRGLAGMVDASRDFLSAWEGWRVEVEDYRELDDERVLVLIDYSGRGKMSGLELGQMRAKGANVLHIHDAKVTKLVRYLDRERAFADLDLAPESGSP